ncbi:MAG: hypothetical protein JXA89_22230 [Anaerolineae bacterium]|nr:hypothetical protein [Anaerolineae bacterium]
MFRSNRPWIIVLARQSLAVLGVAIVTAIVLISRRSPLVWAQDPTPTPAPAAEAPSDQADAAKFKISWDLLASTTIAGLFGGLLYGVKDKKFVWPHKRSKFTWDPGFLADCLFGIAGGVIIFMIVPGNFEFESGGWEAIKILAVSAVGGYGGRALVEKVLSQQLKDLEDSVQALQDQDRLDAVATSLINQHLDPDPDKPPVSEKELKDAIKAASSKIKVLAFDQVREFRKEAFKKHEWAQVSKAIPVLEALIECDTDNKYHRNHGQLGFALKDQPSPDWKRAEQELSTAIEMRDRLKVGGYLVYEFNRALCRIHLSGSLEDIKADLDKALAGEKTGGWIRKPDKELGKDLIAWIKQHYDTLQGWIAQNKIEVAGPPD